MSFMLLQKFKPKSLQEITGNSKQAYEVLEYINSYYREKKTKAIIVSGPTGTGKSLVLEIIAKQLGYELAEYDDVDTAVSSMNQMSMFHKGKIIVLDLDCCTSLRNLKILTEKSRHPVVLMTLDIWESRYAAIRNAHKAVKFYKINSLSIAALLKKLCVSEGIEFDDASMKEFVKGCDGDMRFALLALDSFRKTGVGPEGVKTSSRDGVYSVFDVMNSIFYGSADRNKLSSADPFLLTEFLKNKISEVYTGERLAHAMDCIAKADLFRSRIIKRQAWSLEKYWYDFISFIGKR